MTLDRRKFLVGSGLAASAAIGAGVLKRVDAAREAAGPTTATDRGSMRAQGPVSTDDFDPYAMLTDFDWGQRVTDLGEGRKLREYTIVAVDKMIEIAPGVEFPAWTYNGRVPGPTLRANEGDRIRITFRNDGSHPHTIHFHGIHTPEMDGIPGVGAGMLETGEETVYEFDAVPYGCHLYHCHSTPLKRHIHKGLYGAFIVDPPGGYDEHLGKADHELVMVMNGFDTNFDGDNEIYAVNSKAFAYANKPIEVKQNDLVRIFLVNTTEFDPINSFHLHALFFDYYDTGRLEEGNVKRTVDTIMQCQAQRGILQFRPLYPGPIMFHAHQSEFAELGWLGFFDVQAGSSQPSQPGDAGDQGPVEQVREAVGRAQEEPITPPGGSSPTGSSTVSDVATNASTPQGRIEQLVREADQATRELGDRLASGDEVIG